MNSENNGIAFLIFLMIVLIFSVGAAVGNIKGYYNGIDNSHRDAVLRGFAYYKADEDGKPIFQWKENK